MSTSFKSPLTLYVLWHPQYREGALLANRLFKAFCRDVDDLFARTPGIPVYFRSAPVTEGAKMPRPIPYDAADHTAIIVLVDDHMVIDEQWAKYVAALDAAAAAAGNVRLFPVAVNANAFSFPVANTNFIRLFEVPESPPAVAVDDGSQRRFGPAERITINVFIDGEPAKTVEVDAPAITDRAAVAPDMPAGIVDPALLDRKAAFLRGKLAHELSRFLLDRPRVTARGVVQSAPPIRMFISHAKADGAEIAAAIRDYIHADTSLKSFFDANDIAVGYRFSAELLAAIEESAIVCVQTDYYATREWCAWEVINAKRRDRPLLVVNAVTHHEPRSFPYIGNVPTIRWRLDHPDQKAQIGEVLDMTLFEVLGSQFRERLQAKLVDTFGLPAGTAVLGHPPELFTVLTLAAAGHRDGRGGDQPAYVVYPDPPLGDEEIGLLRDMAPHLQFVTPTMLPLVQLKERHSK